MIIDLLSFIVGSFYVMRVPLRECSTSATYEVSRMEIDLLHDFHLQIRFVSGHDLKIKQQ